MTKLVQIGSLQLFWKQPITFSDNSSWSCGKTIVFMWDVSVEIDKKQYYKRLFGVYFRAMCCLPMLELVCRAAAARSWQ